MRRLSSRNLSRFNLTRSGREGGSSIEMRVGLTVEGIVCNGLSQLQLLHSFLSYSSFLIPSTYHIHFHFYSLSNINSMSSYKSQPYHFSHFHYLFIKSIEHPSLININSSLLTNLLPISSY